MTFLLIGTTDIAFDDDPRTVKISEQEVDYLCACVNAFFSNKITAEDVQHSFSGVRTLITSDQQAPSKLSREYFIENTNSSKRSPLISIYGGKLTTARALAEKAVNKLEKTFPHLHACQTDKMALPRR